MINLPSVVAIGRTVDAFDTLVLDDVRASAAIDIGFVAELPSDETPPVIYIAPICITGVLDSVPTTETVLGELYALTLALKYKALRANCKINAVVDVVVYEFEPELTTVNPAHATQFVLSSLVS